MTADEYLEHYAATPGKRTRYACPFCETGKAVRHDGEVNTCTRCDAVYIDDDDLPAEIDRSDIDQEDLSIDEGDMDVLDPRHVYERQSPMQKPRPGYLWGYMAHGDWPAPATPETDDLPADHSDIDQEVTP